MLKHGVSMVINNTLRMYWQYQYQYFVLNVLIITIPKLISKILNYFLGILFPIQFEVIEIPAILNKTKNYFILLTIHKTIFKNIYHFARRRDVRHIVSSILVKISCHLVRIISTLLR